MRSNDDDFDTEEQAIRFIVERLAGALYPEAIDLCPKPAFDEEKDLPTSPCFEAFHHGRKIHERSSQDLNANRGPGLPSHSSSEENGSGWHLPERRRTA